jgi:hypothetical protein
MLVRLLSGALLGLTFCRYGMRNTVSDLALFVRMPRRVSRLLLWGRLLLLWKALRESYLFWQKRLLLLRGRGRL